ncbi:T9SS-dependent choice-of-anchor J family protein [Hymenobacter properus]|uniref:Choice-of-anchor J domain-containing protein n=1 Tax=Hymenobacter properus TaxID=2791026 RepID=A0A931BH42_9BACT|nr:choice-of-anchor J domain-containing protein [Hymenobacter properus]MBF9143829.1 choice-of-anchor J domain-containing protein [Hymenobacter properus]MBR7722642.1 choice-of-anchor J domain-containing protein [Microvirga sp. SRT04]
MNHQYDRTGPTSRLRHWALAALLATGAVGSAHAQLGYAAANVTNTAGTYTDLGTTGTAISTANTDDANSAATPIGFNFVFNGTTFTNFVLNTNGFIKLGGTAPTGAQYTDGGQSTVNGPIDGADTNLILPFNQDLGPGSAGGTEYRVTTTGTSPNQVCTIQWKNVSDKARGTIGTQYANFSFQAKLYEGSNQIEFVYGTATPGAASADIAKFCLVGIKGSNAAATVLGTKASATPWSGTVFAAGAYTGNGHNVRVTVLPDPGRTYRFSIPVANDAAVSAIQGYASVIVPANNPITLRGVVRNAGTTALTGTAVTLTISGANTYTATQTIASLATNASGVATFSGITLPNAGQNTVTISVASDGNNGNNSVSQPMETSATTFSAATPGALAANSGFNAGDDFFYATKMTLNTPRSITAITALLTDVGNQATAKTSVGESVYGVVVNATTGAVLARSANYVITAADFNVFHTFTLTAPATVPAGDVLIGMAQTASSGTLPYYPFGVQPEDPTRPTTYYRGSATAAAAPVEALTAAGQSIYKFPFGAVTAAPANNDVAVNEIQGYGSIAVPVGNPFSIRAVVRNGGVAAITSPLTVTLTISGANTFTQTQTLTSLPVSGTSVVTFTNISLANVGANTVTVTVPNDDNNANNTASQPMTTSATRFSFETPGATSGGSVFTAGANNYYAAKITLNATRDITSVTALISDAGNQAGAAKTSVGETVYGVVINATTGALLGRSPNYVITAADVNTFHTFTFSAPVNVPAGDVLIGMAQTAPSSGTLPFFPFGVQNESPNRPNTYFTGSATTAAAPTPALATASGSAFKFPFGAETAAPATCLVPTAFTITGSTSSSVSFSFTGRAGAQGYQIVYGPQGFTPGGANSTTTPTFTGTTYTLNGLSGSTAYEFYIRTICSATDQSAPAGPVGITTACTPPVISTYPYNQNFDVISAGQALPCGITVVDSNNDGFTWRATGTVDASLATGNISRSTPNAMVYSYNSADVTVGANDWFFTPALTMTNTQRYRLQFYFRAAAGYPEGLEVKYGTAATAAGQTTTIYTNTNITSTLYRPANNTTTPVVADITPANGNYYIGFHAISAASSGFLAVDDLTISAGPLATSEALKRAVSVFPNPSATGVFNLEIHGANAKQAMVVEVTNMLGQRVYTGTAKDNFQNSVNLSGLQSGIYSITVRNGQEYTQQQIAIVK